MRLLVTGGAGFIGSALIRYLILNTDHQILNLDKLTYASNLTSLSCIEQHENYQFIQLDIVDFNQLKEIIFQYQPDKIIHLAAESHVDNSIQSAFTFIQTNIIGTFNLLEVSRHYWQSLNEERKEDFRFIYVSTDEVYGDLGYSNYLFTEKSNYQPSSPYSATKAAGDHLVQAWHRTYQLPTIITHCTNNYGYFQHSEKLIPLMILNAIQGKKLPIYGDGKQIRDWIFVDDHIKALYQILLRGKIGEVYNISANEQYSNIDVVKMICAFLEKHLPEKPNDIQHYEDLICFVPDRAGHDIAYGLDSQKIRQELAWQPEVQFEIGLEKTVLWYLNQMKIGG